MLSIDRSKFTLVAIVMLSCSCSMRLINVPGEQTGYSNVTNVDVTVEASFSVSKYQFKIMPLEDPNSACGNLNGYGPYLDPGTHLIKDISGMADGKLQLCTRG